MLAPRRSRGIRALATLLFVAGLAHTPRTQTTSPDDTLALLKALMESSGTVPGVTASDGGPDAPEDAPPAAPLPAATPIGEGDNTGFTQPVPGLLEFHARNIDVAEAFGQLRQLLRKNIVVAPGLDARFTGDLYDVTPAEAIDVVCRAAGLTSYEEGPYIYIEPARMRTEIYRLEHSRAADLVTMITPLLSPGGAVAGTLPSQQGIVSSPEEAGGDGYASQDIVVVRDLPEVLSRVDDLIATVDAAPLQVLIEATILTAEMIDSQEIGVDFTALSRLDFIDAGASSPDGLSAAVGPFAAQQLESGFGAAQSNVSSGLGTGGLNIGFLEGGVGVFLKALSEITRTTVLASPKVVTLNKQRGEILLGRREGYLTTTVTQTSTTQEVEYLETGTRLVFRPFIGTQGFVRLEIHPEDSDGGINTLGLPFKDTAEVTTNVLVRSGDTIVVGGLFRERARTVETKVPLLGDIPLLGWLFRGTLDVTVREEVIVVLTPTIIDLLDDADASDGHGAVPASAAWIDPARLHDAWMAAAQGLLDGHHIGGATLLLDAAARLGESSPEVDALRAAVLARALPEVDLAPVDERILHQLVQDAERN